MVYQNRPRRALKQHEKTKGTPDYKKIRLVSRESVRAHGALASFCPKFKHPKPLCRFSPLTVPFGSGVVFGEPAFHVLNRCPETTPDPVAASMQAYLN